MSNSGKNSTSGANKTNNKRRPYSTPKLTVFGSVGVLTQSGAGTKVEGGTKAMSRRP